MLGIARSTLYYEPRENKEKVRIMHAIDELFTEYPFYGSRRIKFALEDDYEIYVCRETVQRYMRRMGLQAVYPKKQTSIPREGHVVYPYLLRGIKARYPDHIWGTDITYVRLEEGFCYLCAIVDWFSRKVLSWELSETLESNFCTKALKHALTTTIPDIHNSDQGSQYTSKEYTDILKEHEVNISMDRRGRCMDNIFTERLWRSVKYENVYLKGYATIEEAREGLRDYFTFYNHKRRHQALNYKTPNDVYENKKNQGRHITRKS